MTPPKLRARTFRVDQDALKILEVYAATRGGSVNDLVNEAVKLHAKRCSAKAKDAVSKL